MKIALKELRTNVWFWDSVQNESFTFLSSKHLYGCKTWSLKLKEGQRLRVLENGAGENVWP
jgi:hypothetical protein